MVTPREQKRDTQAFWDQNPCDSSSSWQQAIEMRYRYTDRYLLPYLQGPLLAGRNVLEVGCGQGLDASEIVRRSGSYVGLDLSPVSLGIARAEVERMRPRETPASFLNGDAEHLPFKSGAFDAVYSCGVLHHTPGFDTALDEIDRVLQPGGKLVLMLYRSFTPLWVVLRVTRAALWTPIVGPWLRDHAVRRLRARLGESGSVAGTALLELVGCPVIDTYTLRGLARRFRGRFRVEESGFYRVGFDQVVRVLPAGLRRRWPQAVAERLERWTGRWFGFFMVVVATKLETH